MAEDPAAVRQRVVARMVAALKKGEPREYFVGLVGYFIEGVPYGASGLSLDGSGTLDPVVTATSFTCTAFFPPDMLQPSTVKKNGVITKNFGGVDRTTVQVKVEVKLLDIWSIAERIGDAQHELFADNETLGARQIQFMIEMQQWFAARSAK